MEHVAKVSSGVPGLENRKFQLQVQLPLNRVDFLYLGGTTESVWAKTFGGWRLCCCSEFSTVDISQKTWGYDRRPGLGYNESRRVLRHLPRG